MSDTVRSLNTSGFTPKKQIQVWSDTLTDLCGHFDIDPLQASSFEGRINYTTVSKLKLCQIEASQHRLAHTAARANLGGHPFVKILFQTYGISHFEQGGRHIELMPGDCLAYDVSCPHTIVSPALTRHEVVIVPKELLQERGFRSAKMSACKLSARTGTGRIAYNFVHAAFDEATKLSPNNAIGVADSLIDLLLLPLREPTRCSIGSDPRRCMSGRSSSSANICATRIFRSTRSRRHWAAPSAICTCCSATGAPLSATISGTPGYRTAARNWRPRPEIRHRRRIFVGLFEFVALQPRVPGVFRNCSVCDLQSAARWPVPGYCLRINSRC